ncbi:MAG: DUF3800 domain-containing protein [Candidatus Bathyarchaeia archaeon]
MLYLLYLDESGDPTGWQDQKHFVLGAVAVHEGQVWRIAKMLDDVQARYFPDVSIPIAFHAAEIRLGRRIFDDLAPNKREQLLDDLYQVLYASQFPNLVAFATAIHVTCVKSADQALHDTFQDVCQRFNTFLVRLFKSGRPSKGLLIIDEAHEGRYRELIAQFRREGTDYGYIDNIVDIPYFTRLRDTRMMQLADLRAYATFRYYEYNDRVYFDKVLPRFDRRLPDHPPDGLKHITMRRDCECEACVWRRRLEQP